MRKAIASKFLDNPPAKREQSTIVTKVGYNDSAVLLASGFCFLCLATILLPEDDLPSRYDLMRGGEPTWKGWFVLVAGVALFLANLSNLFHVVIRKPALEVGEGQLRIWMWPYETIPLGEIAKIRVGDHSVDIIRHGGKRKRLYTSALDEPRSFFFDDVRNQLGSKAIVEEK